MFISFKDSSMNIDKLQRQSMRVSANIFDASQSLGKFETANFQFARFLGTFGRVELPFEHS